MCSCGLQELRDEVRVSNTRQARLMTASALDQSLGTGDLVGERTGEGKKPLGEDRKAGEMDS